MIIYGSKPAHLKTIQLTSTTCPNCNTQGALMLSAYSKHAHVYWIPLFPVGKLGTCECKKCDYAVDETEMPENISWAYNNLKSGNQNTNLAIFWFRNYCHFNWSVYNFK